MSDQSGTATITVIVEDGGLDNDLDTADDNGTFSRTFDVTVNPINDDPTLNALSDVAINEDAAQQTVLLAGITDGDVGTQPLRVTATSNNTGLILNPAVIYTSAESSGSLKFTPVSDQSGTATITVTVKDGGLDGDLGTTGDNALLSRTFTVTVNAANHPPSVANPIPNQPAEENQPFAFAFAADTFHDVDTGDSLMFTAAQHDGSALPEWMGFDGTTRTFSGIPRLGNKGEVQIDVTATDTGALSVYIAFTVTVAADPNPWQNPRQEADARMDVDDNGNVTPLDVLTIINHINRNGAGELSAPISPSDVEHLYIDVNGDNNCTPLDVLELINYINGQAAGEGEAEIASLDDISSALAAGGAWNRPTPFPVSLMVRPMIGGNALFPVEQASPGNARWLDSSDDRPLATSDGETNEAPQTARPPLASSDTPPFSAFDDDPLSEFEDLLDIIARDVAAN